MQWEGPEAHPNIIHVAQDDGGPKELIQPPTPPPALSPSESEEDSDSEDEYVAESETAKGKRPFRVCTLRLPRHVCLLMHGIYSVGRATQPMRRIQINIPTVKPMMQGLASSRKKGEHHLSSRVIASANRAHRTRRGSPSAKSPQMSISPWTRILLGSIALESSGICFVQFSLGILTPTMLLGTRSNYNRSISPMKTTNDCKTRRMSLPPSSSNVCSNSMVNLTNMASKASDPNTSESLLCWPDIVTV